MKTILCSKLSITQSHQEMLWKNEIQKKIESDFYSKKRPPIQFKPKKNSELDFHFSRLIKKLNVRVPIVHIEKNKYLIGSNRCHCSLKGDQVLIRVGGGYERLEEYISSNHDQFAEVLVTHMKNNEWTLNKVLEKLIKGEKIKTSMSATWTMKKNMSSTQNVFNYNKYGEPTITP